MYGWAWCFKLLWYIAMYDALSIGVSGPEILIYAWRQVSLSKLRNSMLTIIVTDA